ncbi:DUF1007 family protein [Roseovarius sp. LXJ103]|uniref:DUF1007 family protein n=1 Tax=Roseovarius carneus TaxID=2853164 RepID=UPI000D62152F|nr:DUF1007 family protein [Roseovarius carneus]MBZ8117056.1 DUF1007 family protein [Roseovarius carneus]PWE37094.1 hypothetical protein DD563_14750 [Pelagicola sp. LXJ1103]
MSRIFLNVTLCALGLGLGLNTAAKAHPHVFVDASTGFVVSDDGALQALRISWTYDAFTTLFLFDALDLDKDRDGALDEADYAVIVQGETDWPPEYKGDVYLEVAGQDHPLGRPENAVASMADNKITVAFDLPLAAPATLGEAEVILRLYDPGFYYDYTILPASEDEGLPTGCKSELVSFKPDSMSSDMLIMLGTLSRDEMPAQDNVGRLFTDEVILTCG